MTGLFGEALLRNIHKNVVLIAQNRAARLVPNCSFYTNVDEMHKQLSWLTLEVKFKHYLLMFMNNAIWKNTPHFFHEQILYSGFCHEHYTRQVSSGHLVVPSHNQNAVIIDLRNISSYSLKKS